MIGERQKVKGRWVFLTICLLFSQSTLADNGRGRHWSEGVYFPVHTLAQQQPRYTYAPELKYDRQSKAPSVGKKKYNPWTIRKAGKPSWRRSGYASSEYPNQDYDRNKNTKQGAHSAAIKGKSHTHHPSEFAAAEYYSGHSRQQLDPSSSRRDYQTRTHGRDFDSRYYAPGDGRDSNDPHYGSPNKPRVLTRGSDHSQRFPSYASLGYPHQDYDPYKVIVRDGPGAAVEGEPYPPRRGDFTAPVYSPGQSRYELDPSPYRSGYQPRDSSRFHELQPYLPGYGIESIFPFHDYANYSWTSLNPYFMYGIGSPYLPHLW